MVWDKCNEEYQKSLSADNDFRGRLEEQYAGISNRGNRLRRLAFIKPARDATMPFVVQKLIGTPVTMKLLEMIPCLTAVVPGNNWNDILCNGPRKYVCQRPA